MWQRKKVPVAYIEVLFDTQINPDLQLAVLSHELASKNKPGRGLIQTQQLRKDKCQPASPPVADTQLSKNLS